MDVVRGHFAKTHGVPVAWPNKGVVFALPEPDGSWRLDGDVFSVTLRSDSLYFISGHVTGLAIVACCTLVYFRRIRVACHNESSSV